MWNSANDCGTRYPPQFVHKCLQLYSPSGMWMCERHGSGNTFFDTNIHWNLIIFLKYFFLIYAHRCRVQQCNTVLQLLYYMKFYHFILYINTSYDYYLNYKHIFYIFSFYYFPVNVRPLWLSTYVWCAVFLLNKNIYKYININLYLYKCNTSSWPPEEKKKSQIFIFFF